MTDIRKAAVFGSGVMGSAIAAHIANAGIPVILFDIVPEGAASRNQLAEAAIERMLKTEPSPFVHPSKAKLVTPANISDHLELLKDVDWIIEAVIERLNIKHDVYQKIETHRKKGSIVSSNTSTIPLKELVRGLPESFQKDFIVTHFFNPPRYMRLLELVGGEKSRKDALETARRFCDIALGKGVVECKDTPGFIANRIGCFWLEVAFRKAIEYGVSVEEADAIMGKPVGIPKTGVFGLFDLIGLDLMPLIAKAFRNTLPANDNFNAMYGEVPIYSRMVAEGYTGRKGKGGFYRMNKVGDKKIKEVKDLQTGDYKPESDAKLESLEVTRKGGLQALVMHPDRGGQYAWAVLSEVLSYAASLVPEIADDITSVDAAMRMGYNWQYGPFELIDRMGGPKWFGERLAAEGRSVPSIIKTASDQMFYSIENGERTYLGLDGKRKTIPFNPEAWALSDIKLKSKPIEKNASAALWDVGDGVACLELTSKMNAVDSAILEMIQTTIQRVQKDFKALIIGGDADNFSVGANINFFLENAGSGNWAAIEGIISQGQQTFKALKYASFPTVGATIGMALGGGCEITLHCTELQSYIEFYPGLVEVNVGVIPGWGGCKEMLLRQQDPVKAFDTIRSARMAKSAEDARDMGIVRSQDRITMNRVRLLADAKARTLELAKSYKAPQPASINIAGKQARATIEQKIESLLQESKITPHDAVIFRALAHVLTGGGADNQSVSEQQLYDLERQAFMELIKLQPSIDRIAHMLKTGKPLKN